MLQSALTLRVVVIAITIHFLGGLFVGSTIAIL
jgi:hypothetical protein